MDQAALEAFFNKIYLQLRSQRIYEGLVVSGVDIGYRYDAGGQRTEEVVVRIHVQQDIRYPTPQSLRIFKFLTIGADLVIGSYYPQEIDPCFSADPIRRTPRSIVQPGLSIGLRECGTLGMFCRDSQGSPCVLSCYHVLQGDAQQRPPLPILQPGPGCDGGDKNKHQIAAYANGTIEGGIDAAYGKLIPVSGRVVNNQQFNTPFIIRAAAQVKLGDSLQKSGRTTGVTTGLIDGIGIYFIPYRNFGVREINGFRVVPNKPGQTSLPGDSGALWFNPITRTGAGLNVAGAGDATGSQQEFSIGCHLTIIMQKLNIFPY